MLLWIFITAASVQIFYWAIVFGRLSFYKSKKESLDAVQIPVSVIICARNEADNLEKNLSLILAQEYSEFELIVADDDSTDKSAELVSALIQSYPNLKYLKLENKKSNGKKAVLAAAVKIAKYDWLLMTDADCRPAGKNWIRTITQKISNKSVEIVLGYGPYLPYPNLLNSWIRYETILTAVQYFSAALWGFPYMGVGRNLLIKKSLWRSNIDALEKNSDLISGDDDLMVNAAANYKNTVICIDKESFVYSEPKHSLEALILQKSRHYSTGIRYKIIHKVLLGTFSLSICVFWISCIPALIYFTKTALLFLILRLLIFLIISNKILHILCEKKLFTKLLFFDFLLSFYYLFFAPALIFKNRKKWK